MLSAQLLELIASHRLADKPFIRFQQFKADIDQKEYATLITNIIDVNRYPENQFGSYPFNIIFSSFQYCEGHQIPRPTTFLAKVYLDIVLSKSTFLTQAEINKAALCCVWMALKYSESAQKSQGFSPSLICEHGGHSFSEEEIIALEVHIFRLLGYRLSYTTPYDVAQTFFRAFPWLNQARKGVTDMIMFALSLPNVSCQKSELIFFSCFLALCQIKNVQFSELQRSIVQSHIVDAQKVSILKDILVNAFGGYDSDQLDDQLDDQASEESTDNEHQE